MVESKRILASLMVVVLLEVVNCKPQRPVSPETEISTFDILLDYDQEYRTNLAQVYRNAMDRFDDFDIAKDKIEEHTDTVGDRIIHVFGVRHETRLAIIRFLRNVLPFIRNPEEWAFLIEGSEDENLWLPEIYFFTGVAKELGIPTFDPIVSPLGEEVTHRLVSGPLPLVNLKDIHFAVFNDLFPDKESLHSLSERARNRYISVIASYSLLPTDSIANLLVEYDTTFLSHPLRLAAARRVFAQIREDMIDTSNVLSHSRAAAIMPKIKDAKHIFICVGAYHLPVFDNIEELLGSADEIHFLPEEESSTK